MRLLQWLRLGLNRPGQDRSAAPRRRGRRLALEQLEDRTVPSNFTATSVANLVADINAANAVGGSNTITLVAGTTFNLSAVDNTTDGATGLPVIAANGNLTIVGNGDTIQRSTARGTPTFRLLDVAAGASLTLQNLTLQGGWILGSEVSAEGGAIYNQGSLELNGVTVQNNRAQGIQSSGSPGYQKLVESAAGGGIYSGGSLTVEASTIQNNQALGGDGLGTKSGWRDPGVGGEGSGGGVYIAGGMATFTNVTLSSNTAQGGNGHSVGGYQAEGGNAFGGGMNVAAGTVSLLSTTVDGNSAIGGGGSAGGVELGGGLYLAAASSVCLDAFTLSHFYHNSASTSGPDIYGSYTTCP
jgi:hypothetical protein